MTSIVTVNFNQPEVTTEFLKSVKINTNSEDIELILVDNGSREDHGETFKNVYPGLIYVRSEQNLGFAGGNNLGIRRAQGEFLLFINNDTEITNTLIPILIEEMEENPEVGLISPLILYHEEKDVIQYAGFSKMNYITARNKSIGKKEKDKSVYNTSYETGYVHGAAMMCRRIDLDKIGLMDENYFLYYEELDWCEKFRRAGKKIWFTGKAYVYHKESISVGKDSATKTYFMHRNRMLFIRKNAPAPRFILFSIYFYFVACPKSMLSYLLKGRKDLVPWVLKAMLWNLTNRKESSYLGYNI